MKNKSLLNKIVAGAIAGGMLLTTSGLVYANTVGSSNSTNTSTVQQQVDHKGFGKEDHKAALKAQLDKLVAAGTLTQDQEDKIIALETQQNEARKTEMDKIKAMTEAERQAYFQANPKEKTNILSQAVTAGIITQTLADTIQQSLPQPKGDDKDHKDPAAKTDMIKSTLDSLVKAGTLTQDQEDKIIAAETQKQEARKAEMDKVKDMTEAERQAYFQANSKSERTAPFADLVTAGVITQAQADAIQKAFPQPDGHRGMKDAAPASSTSTN